MSYIIFAYAGIPKFQSVLSSLKLREHVRPQKCLFPRWNTVPNLGILDEAVCVGNIPEFWKRRVNSYEHMLRAGGDLLENSASSVPPFKVT